MPPNHCKRERQIKIPSDKLSKLDITVDPVVVIPLTDSKKAFVKLSDELQYINGNEPKRAITNQDKIVNKKACLRLIFNFSFLKPTYRTKPIKNVRQLIKKNCFQSSLLFM